MLPHYFKGDHKSNIYCHATIEAIYVSQFTSTTVVALSFPKRIHFLTSTCVELVISAIFGGDLVELVAYQFCPTCGGL